MAGAVLSIPILYPTLLLSVYQRSPLSYFVRLIPRIYRTFPPYSLPGVSEKVERVIHTREHVVGHVRLHECLGALKLST